MLESPILLTNGNKLSADTKEYIESNIKKTYVLGGEAVVSKHVFDDIGYSIIVFKKLPNGGYLTGYGGDYINQNTGEVDPFAMVWGIDNSGKSFIVGYGRGEISFDENHRTPVLETEYYEEIKSIMQKEFDEWGNR